MRFSVHSPRGTISTIFRLLLIAPYERARLLRFSLLLVTLLAAALRLLSKAWVGDDAFITLRTLDNFVNGYGLRYNVLERVQAFTHPLWFMVLAPFYAATREPLVTTMLVSVAISLAALWVLAARLAPRMAWGCLLAVSAVMARTLCHFSTSGLETPLTFLLLALFVLFLRREDQPWMPAAMAGLLLLNRLDLALLVGPAVACLLLQSRASRRVPIAVAVVLPVLLWTAFSLVYYGAPWPNTAYAKLGTGYGTLARVAQGIEYARDFVRDDPSLVVIMVLAAALALRARNWPIKLCGAGMLLYVAYTIAIGGDFMSGRFFSAPGFLAVCLLAATPSPQWLARRGLAAGAAFAALLLALTAARHWARPLPVVRANGIADEMTFYYSDNGLLPVLKRWRARGTEPIHPWGLKGLKFKAASQASGRLFVATYVNAGMPGYYGGPTVHIVDDLGLTDAFIARLPAIPGARVGHYKRVIPAGYIETVAEARPSTRDTPLQPLLEDVTLATRAPLFAQGRWRAIWRLVSGHYNWVYRSDALGTRRSVPRALVSEPPVDH